MTGRYYTPERLGPLCSSGCGLHLPLKLHAAGITSHPTCRKSD